jgi:hypothetical protein
MSDYLRTISKISNATAKKEIKLCISIIRLYYWFNNLGDKINGQMQMKSTTKNLVLLGQFKISYDKENIVFSEIVFASPTKIITISGSFMRIDDTITYYRHRRTRVSVVDA